MCIRKFFHKLKMGFVRRGGNPIPYTSEQKLYGMEGESELVDMIRKQFPSCRIKRNVLIQTKEGVAEIDCLVLYMHKLFAIEVKSWKGDLTETDDGFLQEKLDQWTDELHTKRHSSPFRQIGRAIHLLRTQIKTSAWVNPIVFFEDADSVYVKSENVWFDNISDLVTYIELGGKRSTPDSAKYLFDRCIVADCLVDNYDYLQCRLLDSSLRFETDNGTISRKHISHIEITHHWSYDELDIHLLNGAKHHLELENGTIEVDVNGEIYEYALSKLDYILLGNEEK